MKFNTMKFNTRKIIIVSMLSLALILGAAACGGSSSNGGDTPDDAAPTDTATAPTEDTSGGDVLSGQGIYSGLCVACHGPDATGVEGLGKNLIESEFVAAKSDAELAAFIAEGRPATDADNTTGIDMPPRGGNPALTDDDLLAVVAYLRSLVGE